MSKRNAGETLLTRPPAKLLSVEQAVQQSAFVLKVERRGEQFTFWLHDLRTGARLELSSWQEVALQVEKATQQGLH